MDSSFLERIVAHKRRELAERRAVTPEAELERLAARAPVPRLLGAQGGVFDVAPPGTAGILPASAGRQDAGGPRTELFPPGRLGVIAEVKRASPSKGAIALGLDAIDMARAYAAGEADAISVLTDEEFYRGSLDDLRAIRAAVPTPVMRKDFILDRYGLLEARAAGADLVLLIVAVLGREDLPRLMRETTELGMTPLVEAYTRDEAERALEAGATLIGVNNRDLHTFEVSLQTTERLAPLLAPHATVVSLSGIFDTADAARVVAAGARAILVGEALVRAADPARLIRELRSVPVIPHPPKPGRPSPPIPWLTGPSAAAGGPARLFLTRERGSRPIVKICGLRTVEQARVAAEAGADMVGLVFAESKRRVTVEEARAITAARYERRPRFVGVFVNEDPDAIGRLAGEARLDLAQLSGSESPDMCADLRVPYTKVVHMGAGLTSADLLHIANQYPGAAAIVLDAAGAAGAAGADPLARWGGTGLTVDWRVAAEIARKLDKPVVLAGGLRPDNVAEAIRVVKPWGVDVSGGVETAGVKDGAKIRAFVSAAKIALEGVTS